MAELRGRALMESRYGPLGCGGQLLAIGGACYTPAELLSILGLAFDDSRAIDALALPEGRYVLRYYDGQDQRVVAHEFDSSFRFLGEVRAHIAEWTGEEACFPLFGGH